MALTFRSNGPAGGLVNAQWWNDYYNLFTGVMNDQNVKIANSITMQTPQGKPAAPTLALVTNATGLSVGAYTYCFTDANADGAETPISVTANITTTSTQKQVTVTIGTGPAGTTKRNIYRSKVGGGNTMYLLTTINDNTTTSYTDSTADASLSATPVPLDTALGGIQFLDSNGFNQGWITSSSGRMGMVALHNWYFQVPSATVMLNIDVNGTWLTPNSSSTSILGCGNSVGIKTVGLTKLAEFKNNGNLIIAGTQYQTTAGSISTVTGQTFDAFDVGEVFECDREYPNGTVVCPGPNDKLTQCTHDNCYAAMVISYSPGLGLGANDHANGVHYVALAGRVNVKTAQDIAPRALVVSDGRGGVRQVRPGEPSFVLGFALNSTAVVDKHPQVGVFLRPLFVVLKG